MAHLNSVRFPDDLSVGLEYGPEFEIEVVSFGARGEQRNALSTRGMCSGECGHAVRVPEDFQVLLKHFRSVKGPLHSFRFKDWLDYECGSAEGVLSGIGPSPARNFQLQKLYFTATGFAEVRDIQQPITATVQLYDGATLLTPTTDYTIDDRLGIVTTTADRDAEALRWLGEFDNAVRYATGRMAASMQAFEIAGWDTIPIKEVYLQPEDVE